MPPALEEPRSPYDSSGRQLDRILTGFRVLIHSDKGGDGRVAIAWYEQYESQNDPTTYALRLGSEP